MIQARQDDLRRAAESARMAGTAPRHVHINLSFSWLRRRSAKSTAVRVAPSPRTA
jgi:hypothetical protein